MKNWILILFMSFWGQNLLAQQPNINHYQSSKFVGKESEKESQIIWEASQAFGNSSIPATLQITHYQGDIQVEGYNGKEVLIEAWLKPALMGGTPAQEIFQLIENNNLMALLIDSSLAQKIGAIHLQIKVPEKTTLKIQLKKGGDIQVKNVNRLVEVDNLAGSIYLQDLGGWAIANTENGKILAHFKEVVDKQPMSFITLSGEIDLQLPENIKADFRVRSANSLISNEFNPMQKDTIANQQNYVANTSQSANLLRANELYLQNQNTISNKQAAARGGNERNQLEQKKAIADAQNQITKERGEADLKKNSRNRRTYNLSQSYIGKANEGGGLIYVATRSGEVKIRKNNASQPLDRK